MLLTELVTPEPDDRQIRGACPLDCPDTCSWIVTVRNGEPIALRGDPAHPYTRGSLCNKVENYLAYPLAIVTVCSGGRRATQL
jgi:anaerobic selenocysteine-containing dehydrogenase